MRAALHMQTSRRCKHDLELVTTRLGTASCSILGTVPDAEYMQGFQNLYTLEKGVQNYMKEKGTDLWKGSLFVFDGRMAVRPGAPHTPCNYTCSRLVIHRMCRTEDTMAVLGCTGARALHQCLAYHSSKQGRAELLLWVHLSGHCDATQALHACPLSQGLGSVMQ